MGLFEKFKKKNETHKESYSKEQKELKFIIQQNQAIFGNAFLGKRATDAEITQAEQKLALKIPDPFIWFLKEYGCGGYWFDIMGYCKNGKPEFVEITLEQRKNGLPEKYIIIEDCDEFYYCIDSVSGKISSWSQYDKDGLIISMSFLKIICKMQWIIFRRLEEAIAHREAGKYPISSDILDKTIDELKEILSAEK